MSERARPHHRNKPQSAGLLHVVGVALMVMGSGATGPRAQARPYIVQKHDTLIEIAERFNVSVETLARVNDLQDSDLLKPGQRLEVPSEGNKSVEYVAQKGDSLASIAQEHGISLEQLIQANNLQDPDRIIVGQPLTIPAPASTKTTYTVKKGDALAKIARQYGVSTKILARYNQLENPDRLKVGQTLSIPASGSTPVPQLDPVVRQQLDRTQVYPSRWRYIVIHHSGTPFDTPESMDNYHRRVRHMENGLAYHFVIGNGRNMEDGKIFIGDRWRKQIHGGHLASHELNKQAIGVVLVGNFQKSEPTPKQMRSLIALTDYLMERAGVSRGHVQSHRQINTKPTLCPGNQFPADYLLSRLRR